MRKYLIALQNKEIKFYDLVLFILIIGISFFFSIGIVENNIRIICCIFLFFLLTILALKIERGVIGLLIFLPFMAFIRRLMYYFQPYVPYDPILMISPAITILIFLYIFLFHGREILRKTKENKLLRYITYLFLLFFVQIFNPLQGNLFVGLSGAMFWLIPLIWFYFGFFVPHKTMNTIFYIIIFIGIITLIYGINQIFNGFLPFEEYWIKYGGFRALMIRGAFKAFSTFTNPQEFSLYTIIGSAICLAKAFKKYSSFTPVWIGLSIFFLGGILITSTRYVVFLLFLFIAIFTGIKTKNWKLIFINFIILFVFVRTIIPNIKLREGVVSPLLRHAEHVARGVKHPFNREGSSVWKIPVWTRWTLWELQRYWFGRGLGIGTLGTYKFGVTVDTPGGGGEVHYLGLASACGWPGVILFIIIMYWIIKVCVKLINKDSNLYLLPGFIGICSIFIDPRLYSIGPLIFLLWGWLCKEYHLAFLQKGKNITKH